MLSSFFSDMQSGAADTSLRMPVCDVPTWLALTGQLAATTVLLFPCGTNESMPAKHVIVCFDMQP